MAIKLTLPPTSELLLTSPVQELEFYVKIAAVHFLVSRGACALPLQYWLVEADGVSPSGVPVVLPSFPQAVPVVNARDLMMSRTMTAYEAAYDAVARHLAVACGPDALVEPLR